MSKYKVTATRLNFRPQPGTDNMPLGQLKQGAILEKLEENNDWYFAKINVDSDYFIGDLVGWVSSNHLSPTNPTSESGPFSIDSNLKERPSPLTADLIDRYIQSKNKPLAGIGAAVMAASQKYGINATYIVSHAIHESGWGTSHIAQEKKNLFGWGAEDTDPYDGAKIFSSWEECIDHVMGRVNELYLKESGQYFRGKPCLGDKSYGMNAKYATDPEWGTKIARIARGAENWAADQA